MEHMFWPNLIFTMFMGAVILTGGAWAWVFGFCNLIDWMDKRAKENGTFRCKRCEALDAQAHQDDDGDQAEATDPTARGAAFRGQKH